MALLLGGELALALGRTVVAQSRLRTLLLRDGVAPEAHRRAAALLARSGDVEGAMAGLELALERSADPFPILLDLAGIQEQLGRVEEALAAYERAIAANPGHATPFTRRAVLHLRKIYGAPVPAPPDKRQARHLVDRVTMTSLGHNGRFANQLLQYAFLRCCALVHGLEAQVPEWIGRWLYDLDDPYPTEPLPQLREDGERFFDLAESRSTVVNRDLVTFGFPHAGRYRPHRDFIRRIFRPGHHVAAPLAEGMRRLRARGHTVVAIHVRRGDFGHGPFWIAPEAWYLEWLASVWPTLDRPVLYIASDNPSTIGSFTANAPVSQSDLGPAFPGVEFLHDFHVLSQADALAISNSSFSFTAAMLNERASVFMRPYDRDARLVPFDPWDSYVVLGEGKTP
jgi:tetratricopeptide (TPR) repeat protein